jgi:hypothetical protein
MKFISFLKWLRWFFGFGPKTEKKVEKSVPTSVVLPVKAYKVEHTKHDEARDLLVEKIVQAKVKNQQIQADMFNERLASLRQDVDKRYSKPVEPTNPSEDFITSMAIGYMTDSTVEGTLLGGDMLGAALGDMLNSSDDTPSSNDLDRGFDGGFGDGGFSGGGAGADYSDNTPSYESPSYESPSYDPPSYDSDSNFDDSSSRDLDY